jgi:DNA ligase (NAD+)
VYFKQEVLMDIKILTQKIEAACQAYYGSGSPIMSDAEYDALEDQLRQLDPDHYLLKTVGAPPGDNGWPKVRHGIPMGSLNKAQTHVDLRKWWQSCAPIEPPPLEAPLLVTEKLDGISISIRFEDGKFVQGVTRGDGEIGEDITRNVSLMKGVPHQLGDPPLGSNWTGYLRGEIVCKKSDHKAHFPGDSNPRNTASGTAKRQSDPENCRHLTVLIYQVISDKGIVLSKLSELEAADKMGFITPTYIEANNPREVEHIYQNYVDSAREALDYDIDGLVVEVNSLAHADALGLLHHRPKGAIAYKFPHEAKETILRDVVWQVGNSGRITPVGLFDTVVLAGAKVSRASLATVGRFTKLQLTRGCRILVSRRNDVIPRIEANLDLGVS